MPVTYPDDSRLSKVEAMTDIVERLLDRRFFGQHGMREEAADEITRLRAELARVREETIEECARLIESGVSLRFLDLVDQDILIGQANAIRSLTSEEGK